jgi:hypothetical protein
VLHGMKLAHLDKSDDAKQQLAKKHRLSRT